MYNSKKRSRKIIPDDLQYRSALAILLGLCPRFLRFYKLLAELIFICGTFSGLRSITSWWSDLHRNGKLHARINKQPPHTVELWVCTKLKSWRVEYDSFTRTLRLKTLYLKRISFRRYQSVLVILTFRRLLIVLAEVLTKTTWILDAVQLLSCFKGQ